MQNYPAGSAPYAVPAPYVPPAFGQPYATYPPAFQAPHGYGAGQAMGGADEVRTIFITGFPADVKDRELNNLLRFVAGYEAGQMNWKNGQAQGFALFSTAAFARQACDLITQLNFDESGSVLRCEMARKNMYIKDDGTMKRPRTTGNSVAPMAPPPMGMHAASYGAGGGMASYGAGPAPAPSLSRAPMSYGAGSATGDNPPCNTLYVGNLGDNVSENELQAVFGAFPGYRVLKLQRGARGATNCFVDFEDIASATVVHDTQQGLVLQSSDRGPIRVQYSKNPYGKKRDRDSGVIIDTLPRDYPAPGTA